jgi:hypothetical protein
MVEIFFGIITRQVIRRGSFRSVRDLVDTILTKAIRSPKSKDSTLTRH